MNNSYNAGVGNELLAANSGLLYADSGASAGLRIISGHATTAKIIFGIGGYATCK